MTAAHERVHTGRGDSPDGRPTETRNSVAGGIHLLIRAVSTCARRLTSPDVQLVAHEQLVGHESAKTVARHVRAAQRRGKLGHAQRGNRDELFSLSHRMSPCRPLFRVA